MDLICARCGESWDLSHVNTEMNHRDRSDLKQGICCPCCNIDEPYDEETVRKAAHAMAKAYGTDTQMLIEEWLERYF